MKTASIDHPADSLLSAYSVGLLEADEAAAIDSHIIDCGSCCSKLSGFPDDGFIGLLRECDPASPQESSLVDASAASRTASDISWAKRVPPELVDHPKYRIVGFLGRGGMGVVYRAEHRTMNRDVAIKVISPAPMQQADAVDRFQREVHAAARLHHPNIVTAYDADEVKAMHFLVMEYVEGQNLAEIIRQQSRLPVNTACNYIRQAALGLEHAHERGMVHRDIKPQNLMLTPAGDVKILDFGLATIATAAMADRSYLTLGTTAVDGHLTQTNFTVGTPDYMAPEQTLDSRGADIRGDIYSLGCTLYYLLTGQPPFADQSLAKKLESHRSRAARPISELRSDVPAEVVRIVNKMMAKDPKDRHQTPRELAEVLAPYASERKLNRSWVHIAVYAAVALLVGAFAVLLVDRFKGNENTQGGEPRNDVRSSVTPALNLPPNLAAVRVSAPAVLSSEDINAAPRLPGWGGSWSPDKKLIVIAGRKDHLELWDPEKRIRVLELPKGSDAVWSPRTDGAIAYCVGTGPEIWLVEPDGSKPRRIADGMFPNWSADGKTLYFFDVSTETLCSIAIDSAKADVKPLMTIPSAWPAVSPNEKYVAFHDANAGQLLIVELATKKVVLRHDVNWHGLLARWSPDSRYLGFGSFGNGVGLWMLDLQTRKYWKVAGGSLTLPCWSADGLRMIVDDRSTLEVLIFDTAKFMKPPIEDFSRDW